MMDKKTVPSSLWIQLDNNPEYLKELKNNSSDLDNSDTLFISDDKCSLKPSETYFDADSNSIEISFEAISPSGSTYISMSLPLSDAMLVDILGHSIKKLNKLKVAMESLK